MYDFVVVGAGPAGSRFAREAADAGHNTVVFETGSIGTPLACSGHVSTDLWEYVPDDAKPDLLQNRISGARFHTGGPGSDPYHFYKHEPVSNVIDRVGLDRTLAACARDAGATVRDGHTVMGVDERADRVIVEVSVAGGGTETVETRMVAGCDGPTSTVRQSVGLPRPTELLHGVLGFDPEPDDGNYVDVHLTAPSFFAWRIPRGDAGVEYGLAAPPGDDLVGRFDRLCSAYRADTTKRCSGAIPIGPPDTVTTDRVFLIGDAAAQTKPFTGGGILYGMRAADAAASTIDPERPASLDAYESGWREELGREIRLGKAVRACYSLPEPVHRVGLWELSGEIGVHMYEPSSFFSRAHLRRLLS